jgi:hypothetical protein
MRPEHYEELKEIDETIESLRKKREELVQKSIEKLPIKPGTRVIVYVDRSYPRVAYLNGYSYSSIDHRLHPYFYEMSADGSMGYKRMRDYCDAYDFEDASDIPDIKKFIAKIIKEMKDKPE